jgi:hypothetical protein
MMFAVSAVAQAATVNVSLEPSTKTVLVNDTFELKLWLKSSDGTTIVFDDAHLLLEWDPMYVSFSGSASTADGDYDWTAAMSFMGIVQPMYQFEGSGGFNETYDDGDAKINLYPFFAPFKGMVLPQTDLNALTLTFTALDYIVDSTVIAIRPMTYAECGVNSGIVGPSGFPIGGIGTGATVKIYDPLTVTCTGFEPPMDKGAVKVKKNRVLPLKAELLDGDGYLVTDSDITAPPVIQVIFQPTVGDAEDVTNEALSAGQGTDGNQFEFSDGKWQFNLKTKNYSGAGTYTITMVSGDECEYVIDTTCTASFMIE